LQHSTQYELDGAKWRFMLRRFSRANRARGEILQGSTMWTRFLRTGKRF